MPTADRNSKKSTSASALFGAAILHLVPGLLFWPVAGISWDVNDIVRIGGATFLVVMAIWARRSPLLPVVISTVLYCGYLAMQLFQSGTISSLLPWIVQGTVLLVLFVGLVNGVRSIRQMQPMSDS